MNLKYKVYYLKNKVLLLVMYKTKYENKGISGLINRGNTCFLNTAIQCISHVMPLTDFFVSEEYLEYYSRKKKEFRLCKQYAILIKGLWEENCTVDPESFHITFQNNDDNFNNYDQHDAQEALSIILDSIHETLNYEVDIEFEGNPENDTDLLMIESIKHWSKLFSTNYSIIVDLFFGQYISKIYDIETNKQISQSFDAFNVLTLPISGDTLYECFNNFISFENIDQNYLNEADNKKYKIKRQIKLCRIPNYLIIVLKRFRYNGTSYIKIYDNVSFPITDLNLGKFTEGYESYNCIMDLKCIGCHTGDINGGHYYAVCKHVSDKWYEFNDRARTYLNINNSLPQIYKNAYILIYEKRE